MSLKAIPVSVVETDRGAISVKHVVCWEVSCHHELKERPAVRAIRRDRVHNCTETGANLFPITSSSGVKQCGRQGFQ